MPRIHKTLPAERSKWSFGDLVYWHLFEFGTRPSIDPSAAVGREWEAGNICGLLGVTERTLRNWIAGRNFPDSAAPLAEELFGDNPRYDIARLELAEALRASRARRKKKGVLGGLMNLIPSADNEQPADADSATPPEAGGNDQEMAAPRGVAKDKAASRRIQKGGRRSLMLFIGRALVRTRQGADPANDWYRFTSGRTRARPPPRRVGSVLVAGLAIVAGVVAWLLRPSLAPSPETKTAAQEPTPAPPARDDDAERKAAEEQRRQREAAEEKERAEVAARQAAEKQRLEREAAEKAAHEKELHTQEDAKRKAAEEDQIERDAIAARKAAREKADRDRDDQARRRDQVAAAEIKAQNDRAWNARQIAGIGYDLAENTSVTGPSAGLVYVESVIDCALKCASISCEAFAFSANGTKMHGCYRYNAPVSLYPHPGYSAGQRIAAAAPARREADEATSKAPPAPPPDDTVAHAGTPPKDDLTRCANGPFKVSGFRLICGRILGGGTSLGSHRLRYVVADINACAAYCRPIPRCVGFTYNAAQRGDKHDCQIFGPTPSSNEGEAWVSGVR